MPKNDQEQTYLILATELVTFKDNGKQMMKVSIWDLVRNKLSEVWSTAEQLDEAGYDAGMVIDPTNVVQVKIDVAANLGGKARIERIELA